MRKAVDKATGILMVVSCVIFSVVILIVIANILGRRLLNLPVKGAIELVQYGIMLGVGLVMARTGFEGKHIYVPILIDRFGQVGKQVFILFGSICGTGVFAVLGYLFIKEAPSYYGTAGRITDAWRIPYYIIYAIMGVGFTIATLTSLFGVGVNTALLFKKPDIAADAAQLSASDDSAF